MKISKISVIALVLTALAVGAVYYKHKRLGLPLQPAQQSEVWTVEAKLQFRANGGPVKVQFYIPRSPPGFIKLNEDFISSNYGLATEADGLNRQALWAVRRAKGKQVLYYRMEFVQSRVGCHKKDAQRTYRQQMYKNFTSCLTR